MGLVILLTGCTTGPRVMMPTPNVYVGTERDVYADLTQPLKTSEVPLFYITDRVPEQDDEGNLRYGTGRSGSLAFGSTVVDLGVDITWDELVAASRTQSRLKPVHLKLREVTELIRGPNTPLPYALKDGKVVYEPKLLAQRQAAAEAFHSALVKQLALTPRKEVFIYVHGYNNTFDDAAFAMAELWHFLGRIGVPIIYTWPAGHPGLFGYTYDRESSEFTVYHLREVLGFMASFPEVDKIHLIAHSRGTDVAIAAVRELTLLARGAGIDPREKYKIHNLVLAAPDLDVQVATQRIAGDMLELSVNRFTVYTSPADQAIGVAQMLFQSPRGRIGTLALGLEDVDEAIKDRMEYDRRKHSRSNLVIVKFAGAADAQHSKLDRYGHSYFRDAPTVSSDLVLLLRDDLDPGTPGRPLEPIRHQLWRIPPDFPRKAAND
ncbi:MAG: alpha/beta hydrolase [Gammaproteobacteria bacterium]